MLVRAVQTSKKSTFESKEIHWFFLLLKEDSLQRFHQ